METFKKVVGGRIKKLRKDKSLSQAQLAQRADLHFSYVAQIERGEKMPSLKSLERISEALDADMQYLIAAEKQEKEEWEEELMQFMKRLDKKQRNLVSDFVKLLVKHKPGV